MSTEDSLGAAEQTAAALAAAGEAMGGCALSAPDVPLQGSDRSVVLRAVVDGGPRTVIVKTFNPAEGGEGWLREASALSVLRGRGAPVPTLVAVAESPQLVVTEDLGSWSSVADAVLGVDRIAATESLTAWAGALASVHSRTVGAGETFAAALAQHSGDAGIAVDPIPEMLGWVATGLATQLPALGITPDPAALDELRDAAAALGDSAVALTPADACPDNNLMTGDGLILLDFEGAAVRHVAWDVVYLDVPWPTCWCAWRLPDDVADDALSVWRSAVAPALPAVTSDAFHAELAVATLAWAMISTSWFLTQAIEEGTAAHPGARGLSPSSRAAIQHRLARAVSAGPRVLPRLADLAEQTLRATRRDWGEVPLNLAPAFRSA